MIAAGPERTAQEASRAGALRMLEIVRKRILDGGEPLEVVLFLAWRGDRTSESTTRSHREAAAQEPAWPEGEGEGPNGYPLSWL